MKQSKLLEKLNPVAATLVARTSTRFREGGLRFNAKVERRTDATPSIGTAEADTREAAIARAAGLQNPRAYRFAGGRDADLQAETAEFHGRELHLAVSGELLMVL